MVSRVVRLGPLALALVMPAAAQARDASTLALEAFAQRQDRLAQMGDTMRAGKALADRIFVSNFEPGDVNCDLDSDGDSLPDCVETGTGIFVSIENTGTDPANPDTDGDGINDGDEVVGTADGLDLPALGVNPLRKDLLIEYDWFDDVSECGAHSHAPSAAVLERVAAIFAQAPVQNPDGSTGINVIQDAGQGGPLSGGNLVEGDATLPGAFDATWAAIKAGNFDARRGGYFRYVLMAHRYHETSNSSGAGEIVGDDSLITLQCYQTENNAVRTIAHELGHNLGLYHGGFELCNSKPNYNSLMNYRYQFEGLDTECIAGGDGRSEGFSPGTRVSIDEAAIDESQGVCGNPPIDWNYNGSLETGLALDLNPGNENTCGSALNVMHDFDDWSNITFFGLRDAQGLLKSIKELAICGGAPVPTH